MNMTDYAITDFDMDAWAFVQANADEQIKRMFSLVPKEDIELSLNTPHKFCFRFKEIPFSIFGFVPTEACKWFWYFGTKDAAKHVRFVHTVGPSILKRMNECDARPLRMCLHQDHTNILNWLLRVGFDFHSKFGEQPNTYFILEYI